MNKVIGFMLGASLLVGVGTALAATTQTNLLLDGNTTAIVEAGDSMDAKVTYNLTGNSTAQSVKVEIPNSHFPGACINITDVNSAGTHTVILPVDTTGSSEGTWDVRTTFYGIPSNQTGANNNCDATLPGTPNAHTFQNQLTITAAQNSGTNSNSTGGTGNTSGGTNNNTTPKWFTDWLATQHPATPSPTPASLACAQLSSVMVGTQMGVYNSANIALQGFLLYQHQSIPWLAQGASFGFFGVQTNAALSAFKSQNGCV